MWVGSATCSTLPVAPEVGPPPTWCSRGKSSEHTYCFNFKALCLVSEEASFGLQFLVSTISTLTRFHTQMSKQPVAAKVDASSVARGVDLFLHSHTDPTSFGVPLHLPVIMSVLMEAAYSGNTDTGPAPWLSLHDVSVVLTWCYVLSHTSRECNSSATKEYPLKVFTRFILDGNSGRGINPSSKQVGALD